VGGSKAGVNSLQLVEGVEQLLGKDWIGKGASQHAFLVGSVV
jgi:hypothetical protein